MNAPNGATMAGRTAFLEAVAVDVAKLAGNFVREQLGSARAVTTKTTPSDVVTFTDLETERLIRHELANRTPESTIVGEELDDQQGGDRIGWIVDPIDGTINFLYNLPVVSVSIAATYRGAVVAGAVTDVLLNQTFSAGAGAGARCEGTTIAVSGADDLAISLIGTGFAYDADHRRAEAEVFGRLLPEARDIRCFGSAALHLCWVACGRLDGYYQRGLKVYDYAAGALIAAEGGAVVKQPPNNDSDLLLATTPALFEPIQSLVADTGDAGDHA